MLVNKLHSLPVLMRLSVKVKHQNVYLNVCELLLQVSSRK